MILPIVQNVSAHGVSTGGGAPRFGRIDDLSLSKKLIQTGDTTTITGKIVYMQQNHTQGWLTVHSKPGSYGRWSVVSMQPSEHLIDIPGNSVIPFSITLKALQPGTYNFSSWVYLVGIGPAMSSLYGNNRTAPTIVVTGNPICKEGFAAVSKTEDGTSACVKPDNAIKLIYRGWAKEFIQSTAWNNLSMCEGTEIPSGDFRKNIFPVLVMSPNSTATVCVTYNILSDWQSYPNKQVYPHGILETCCLVNMGSYSSSVLPNKFEILANPPLFNVTGVHNGSKINVTYKIYAKPDSKGTYDTSVPFDGCLSYPLAVGFSLSEIDATKFQDANFAIPCFNTIDNVDSVKIVSGMTYKEVQFP